MHTLTFLPGFIFLPELTPLSVHRFSHKHKAAAGMGLAKVDATTSLVLILAKLVVISTLYPEVSKARAQGSVVWLADPLPSFLGGKRTKVKGRQSDQGVWAWGCVVCMWSFPKFWLLVESLASHSVSHICRGVEDTGVSTCTLSPSAPPTSPGGRGAGEGRVLLLQTHQEHLLQQLPKPEARHTPDTAHLCWFIR